MVVPSADSSRSVEVTWQIKQVDMDVPALEAREKMESAKKSVKSTCPDTENHDKNGYVFQDNDKNFIMTNVDNSDTKYTNTNDTNNHNAHNLHK